MWPKSYDMKIQISSGNSFNSGKYGFLTRVVVMTLATILAAKLLPGVTISSTWAAVTTALVIALLDNFIRPILVVITLPVTLISMGLFIFVVNAVIIMMAAAMVRGFTVDSFMDGLLFSLLLTLLSYLLELPNKLANRNQYVERDQRPDDDTDDEGFTPYEEVE